MIIMKILDDGGFVCGDTATGRTAYAYPTSTHAVAAKRGKCAATAREMLDGENGCGAWRDAATAKAFDARNMALLQD
jgi:hypothetical protein